MKNKMRKALLDRQLTLGSWMQIGHPAIAEILADVGFDWLCVDLEHGTIDLESLASVFRALEGTECVPVARLPGNDPVWIHRVLDAGAQGLVVPMVNSAEEAAAAIREAKYPPEGNRGFGYSRANQHGARFSEYIENANDEIALIAQIEHIDAISHLDAILAVEGIDALFIGPLDLTGSMGITGQMEHPETQQALEIYREKCQAGGISSGYHVVDPSPVALETAIDRGHNLIAVSVDNVLLRSAACSMLETARALDR